MDVSILNRDCVITDKDGEEVKIVLDKEMKDIGTWIMRNYIVKKDGVRLTKGKILKILNGGDLGLLRLNTKWTEEEKCNLKDLIDGKLSSMLYNEIDWNEVEVVMKRPKKSCKVMYDEMVPLHIRMVRDWECLMNFDCNTELKECPICRRVYYTVKEWRGVWICETCHLSMKDEIDEMWTKIRVTNECEICGDEGRHYDHKDIFTKDLAVSTMIDMGRSYEDIVKERDKCRLLCKRCHGVMSHYERVYQLISLKRMKEMPEIENVDIKLRLLQDKIYEEVKRVCNVVGWDV